MKKILIFATIFTLFGIPCFAEDIQSNTPEQNIKNDQSYFTANLQKQPQENGGKQGISNHFTFFTINVNVNGQAKENSSKTEK